MRQPNDSAARQQALDASQSFICEAPAGSGKTELLTQRFLTLLARVEKPEQILAITFTRKAVGEMRERILTALRASQQPKPKEPHKQLTWRLATQAIQTDHQYQWQLLQNPNRLQIKTFDSLCGALVAQMPVTSALGFKPQVAEDPSQLYQQAAHNLMQTLEEDGPRADSLALLLSLLDNRVSKVQALFEKMLPNRQQWLAHINRHELGLINEADKESEIREILEEGFSAAINETIQGCKTLLGKTQQQELCRLANYAALNLSQEASLSKNAELILNCSIEDPADKKIMDASFNELFYWQGLCELLITTEDKWRTAMSVKTGFPAGPKDDKAAKSLAKQYKDEFKELIHELQQQEALLPLLHQIRSLPEPQLSDSQWQLLQAVFQLLPLLLAHLQLVFKQANQVDFTEISLRAIDALGSFDDPSELVLMLDYQIQHLLVDEFQDTSSSQVKLLNQLTHGWQPDDGRTLFCVGDAMQSIYGFRGANVGLFLRCRDQGLQNPAIRLQPLRLTTNFRSQAGVVDWVNEVFHGAFPQQNDLALGGVRYSPSIAFNKAGVKPAVTLYATTAESAEQGRLQQAQKAIELIQQCRQENADARIAVLVRNRNQAQEIVKQLQVAAMRFRAVDLEPLADHSLIQDLLALTRALLHPGDRIAWLAILRAPWCGLSLADLEKLARWQLPTESQGLPLVLDQASAIHELSGELSEAGLRRLQRVVPVLLAAVQQRHRKTLRNWVEGTWIALAGPATAVDAAALQNAEKYFQLLENWPSAMALPALEQLLAAVDRLYAAPDPLADERLQIMTIHKSKGLEFDVVIVPELDRGSKVQDPELITWQERVNNLDGDESLMLVPIGAAGQDTHPNLKHVKFISDKKLQYETVRLLYVACTRAKQQLYLLAHLKPKLDKDSQQPIGYGEPTKHSLLRYIWPAVAEQVEEIPLDERGYMIAVENAADIKRQITRLADDWRYPALPQGHLLDGYVPAYDYQNPALSDFGWLDPTPRYTGELVHQYLQLITESGVSNWSQARIQQQRSRISQALLQLGLPQAKLTAATDRVIQALAQVLRDEDGRRCLSDAYSFHACEYPLQVFADEGESAEFRSLRIDRLFTDADGITWVVDYKTAEPAPQQSLEAFAGQQQDHYLSQLQGYRRALQRAGFGEIRLALYFPLVSYWHEVA